ncbi:MAG: DsbA family protein [Chloroflexi bacterium]|uniref:thioredoxin domain-containing protein n=1 Tax=Candidatus Flexifilum breve TaxID=3140694 RepID=UPI003136BC3E|nr:DsbA family protein [Chloroflexota bacterium]MBK9751601.1 DsbA family protein [Chloroflexota bacterium]
MQNDLNPTPNEAPVIPETAPIPTPATPVVTVQPATLNYIVVGLVCLVIGAIMGMVIAQRMESSAGIDQTQVEAIINSAVATAVAAVPQNTAATAQGLNENTVYTVSTEGDPFVGPEDAPITIVEFGDFRCGYCRRHFEETFEPLLAAYEGEVRYVFRDYPILSQESLVAALAAECAHDQGAFWEFHDRVYSNQNVLTREQFISYATELGLDTATFTTCLDEQQHLDEVVQDYQDGQTLGVGGTPTFFINGKPLIGAQPYSQFQLRFDAELAAATTSTAGTN